MTQKTITKSATSTGCSFHWDRIVYSLVIIVIPLCSSAQNISPVANDDVAETDLNQDVVINVVANDTDSDGIIEATSVVAITGNLPRYVAQFDGVNSRITWGNLGVNGTSALSKFIRFRTTDTQGILFDAEFGGGGKDGGLYLSGGILRLRCAFANSGTQTLDLTAAGVANDGTWHSAGFVYDGTTLTGYFDGSEVGTALPIPGDIILHNYASTCGRRVASSSWYLQGELADFVVYDAGVSAGDAAGYHTGTVRVDDLVLWGSMAESDYSSGLADASGKGNAGTNDGAIPLFETTIVNPTLQHGSLSNNGDGIITYSPDAEFVGVDRFGYTVKDDRGALSNTARVTVTILDPLRVDTDGDGIFDAFDSTPDMLSFPKTHPLYFDADANGFSFPLLVQDNSAAIQLDELINFGDAATPFPQQFDPFLNDWVEATHLLPNVGYLAHGLDDENAMVAAGEVSADFSLELKIGHNLIAMPLTTAYPQSESAIVNIFEEDRGTQITPPLATSDTLFKNKLYWIKSATAFSTDTLTWITDADDDTIADDWERRIIDDDLLDAIDAIVAVNPDDDYDGDGLSNLYEYRVDTDPTIADSDGDTLLDAWEVNFSRIAIPIVPPPLIMWRFNEGTGNSIANEQGTDFTGTISGGPSFEDSRFLADIDAPLTSEVFDEALSLSNTDAIEIAAGDDLNSLNTWDAISISLWIAVDSFQSGYIISRDNDNGDTLFSIRVNTLGELVASANDNGSLDEITTTDLAFDDGQWHHVLLSIAPATTMVFYVNGERIAGMPPLASFDLDGQLNPLILGNRVPDTDGITGVVDEVRIFNEPLTLLHATILYQPVTDMDGMRSPIWGNTGSAQTRTTRIPMVTG